MWQFLYFFIPAYIANTFPPIFAKIPGLKEWSVPIDGGCTFRGKRLLGKNKTWRGLILGTVCGGLFFLLQQQFPVTNIPYNSLPSWFGFVLAFGALFGDALFSFIKRQLNIRPGKPWIPFDQIDFVLGAFLLTFWFYWPGLWPFLFILVVSALGTYLAHVIGYKMRINKDKM